MSTGRATFETIGFALVICRCPFPDSEFYNKWLAVNETENRGWWIPAGGVYLVRINMSRRVGTWTSRGRGQCMHGWGGCEQINMS